MLLHCDGGLLERKETEIIREKEARRAEFRQVPVQTVVVLRREVEGSRVYLVLLCNNNTEYWQPWGPQPWCPEDLFIYLRQDHTM